MSVQAISTKLISTLGNKESLIPIMLKDGVDSTSLTIKSFKEGGSVEGIDRAIDEFGTQAIWIGGIPFFKKLFDWTAYKIARINPGVDPRIIANEEYAQWAKDNAQGIMGNTETKSGLTKIAENLTKKITGKENIQSVKDAITDSLKDGGEKAKNLYKGKIITATALTLATFFLLTKTKQKNTKNTVIKDMQQEVKKTDNTNYFIDEIEIFSDIEKIEQKKKQSQPAFKGIIKNVTDAVMFNPVHNMKIIDAGITAERIGCSRNKTEFFEHTIKEGGFLFFLYGFGNMIEKGINKFSDKKLNKPIDLAIEVLMDNKFSQALENGKIVSDLTEVPRGNNLTEKLNFIVQNPQNILVEAAKKSKIVSTVKDAAGNSVVDTSKYIDIQAFDDLAANLSNINEKFNLSNETVNKFLNKTKALKIGSVMANIGISCLFLGYLIPKLVYKYREIKTGTTKFHVAEDIKRNEKKEK